MVLAQGFIGRLPDRCAAARGRGQGLAHANVLGPLAGENERESHCARNRSRAVPSALRECMQSCTYVRPAALAPTTATCQPAVIAARDQMQNPRQLSDRIAMGRALWRDLVVGFAAQLAQLGLGFAQLAALYAIDGTATLTVADLAELIGRSPSATSRLVSELERRGLVERREEVADRRQRQIEITAAGHALLAQVDGARAEQFLSVVRPLPAAERALVAMGVAALSSRAVTRRGRLIKS